MDSTEIIFKKFAMVRTPWRKAAWAFAVFSTLFVVPAWAGERIFLGNTQVGALATSADSGVVQRLNLLRQQAAIGGTVRVIVGVRAAFAPEGRMAAAEVLQQRSEITAAHLAVLDQVPSLRVDQQRIKRFESVPFMAMQVTPAELEALAALPQVTSIDEDRIAKAHLAQSVPLVGGVAAWASGYTGAGVKVAILDTGVDKTHPFLAGKVVSEACYSTNDGPSGASTICPGGVTSSTAAGSALPYSSGVCPVGECDHGTHVAGTAAGNGAGLPGVGFSGVAKDASVIAIQVFSRFTPTACGSASPCAMSFESDQILGLERVLALSGSYSIAAVNMSLGGGNYSSQSVCDAANPGTKAAIDNLRAANIATVISSGNAGYSASISAPACISSAISVGATWDVAGSSNTCNGNSLGTSSVNAVACYSNSVPFLNLLAPGSLITSSIPGGGYAGWHGTSMAAPHVAGAWALLKQKSPGITVGTALAALTSTGLSVTDPRNAVVKPRIRVDAALSTIGATVTVPDAPTGLVAAPGNGSASISFTAPAFDGGAAISSYTASCSVARGATATASATASPINVSGMNNGAQYSCSVRAWNSVGPSVPSAAVLVIPTGASCVYALGASGVSVGAGTSFGNVGVTTGAACPWTALSNASWLAVTSGAVGTGNGSVGYSVAANAGVGSRIGTLTIAGQTFTVTQAGGGATVTVPDAPTGLVAAPGNGSASISFTAPAFDGGAAISSYTASCSVARGATATASATASPINVSGMNNGAQYSCSVRAWNSVGPSVPSAAVLVIPTGASCVYALGASGVSVGAGTSFGNVGVTTGAACPWTALSNASWLAVTSGAVGTGNGSVGYSVAANAGVGSRIGTLTIAGQTFTVTQAGALSPPVCTLTAIPSSVPLGGISTLTATCSPAATSYGWTGSGCVGNTTASCTIAAVATSVYTVTGTNAGGTGPAASAVVTVFGTRGFSQR